MKKVVIVSGFSGVGKGTVIEEVIKRDRNIRLSISDTNRIKRNETDRYHFISTSEFEKNLSEGRYLEHNKYGNHYYGTPKQPVFDAINDREGHPIILEIDVHGMRQVRQNKDLKDMGAELISVMLVTEAATLKDRLVNRGDSKQDICKRLNIAFEESQCVVQEYDHILVNHTVKETTDKLYALFQGEEIEEDEFDGEKFRQEMAAILADFDLNP